MIKVGGRKYGVREIVYTYHLHVHVLVHVRAHVHKHRHTPTHTYSIYTCTCTCNYKHTQLTHATHTLLPPSPSQNLFSPPLSDHALAQTAQCTAHTPSSWSASASSWITSCLLCSLSQCMTTSGFDIIQRSRSLKKMTDSSILSSPSRCAQRYVEGSGTLAAYI